MPQALKSEQSRVCVPPLHVDHGSHSQFSVHGLQLCVSAGLPVFELQILVSTHVLVCVAPLHALQEPQTHAGEQAPPLPPPPPPLGGAVVNVAEITDVVAVTEAFVLKNAVTVAVNVPVEFVLVIVNVTVPISFCCSVMFDALSETLDALSMFAAVMLYVLVPVPLLPIKIAKSTDVLVVLLLVALCVMLTLATVVMLVMNAEVVALIDASDERRAVTVALNWPAEVLPMSSVTVPVD